METISNRSPSKVLIGFGLEASALAILRVTVSDKEPTAVIINTDLALSFVSLLWNIDSAASLRDFMSNVPGVRRSACPVIGPDANLLTFLVMMMMVNQLHQVTCISKMFSVETNFKSVENLLLLKL
mmetsp:Transcript_692/g.893  ORF Transcript_692/g.893 Transcript_692/m.893 type:complete len:126 (+) Transcript_692:925-1302(+)